MKSRPSAHPVRGSPPEASDACPPRPRARTDEGVPACPAFSLSSTGALKGEGETPAGSGDGATGTADGERDIRNMSSGVQWDSSMGGEFGNACGEEPFNVTLF